MTSSVDEHYALSNIEEIILRALSDSGVDTDKLTIDDLAPVDAFHIRGREATAELADWTHLGPTDRVLDVGSGIGGTSRFLADRCGCKVSGIDLTDVFCRTASSLSARVGLSHLTDYRQGSALDLPFPDGHFDVVWTEHVQMNIEDKTRFYSEMFRVLKAGGRLAFHDIFAGPGEGFDFPVPWASEPSQSFLWRVDRLKVVLSEIGFRQLRFEEKTTESQRFFVERMASPPPPGTPRIGLLMGDTAPIKFGSMVSNFEANRLRVVQALLQK